MNLIAEERAQIEEASRALKAEQERRQRAAELGQGDRYRTELEDGARRGTELDSERGIYKVDGVQGVSK
jgi:hypothetical protein